MDLDTQGRDDTIASIKDHPQVDQFFNTLEQITAQQLKIIDDHYNHFDIESSNDTIERYNEICRQALKVSGSTLQHLRSRLLNTTRHKIDLPTLSEGKLGRSSRIIDNAPLALRATLNRHKLTDEEYQWFIGPYLAAGFPREIFYPEEPPPQG